MKLREAFRVTSGVNDGHDHGFLSVFCFQTVEAVQGDVLGAGAAIHLQFSLVEVQDGPQVQEVTHEFGGPANSSAAAQVLQRGHAEFGEHLLSGLLNDALDVVQRLSLVGSSFSGNRQFGEGRGRQVTVDHADSFGFRQSLPGQAGVLHGIREFSGDVETDHGLVGLKELQVMLLEHIDADGTGSGLSSRQHVLVDRVRLDFLPVEESLAIQVNVQGDDMNAKVLRRLRGQVAGGVSQDSDHDDLIKQNACSVRCQKPNKFGQVQTGTPLTR